MKKIVWLFLMSVVLVPLPLYADVYTTGQGYIYHNEHAIRLYGINWFGFETQSHIVHGLWARGYKEMIAQMKSLGFNAVRLPFCPQSLRWTTLPTGYIEYTKNPDLKGLTSLQIMDKIIEEFNRQEMYILLDHHTTDSETISPLWYTDQYSEEQWICDLQFVALRYRDLPYFMGIDLKNEPHGTATWGTGNSATDWNSAAERAAAAVLRVNPKVLIFVEGIQENTPSTLYSSTIPHWAGGNLEPQQYVALNIPADKLILSPHVYGPDVYPQSYFDDPAFPNNMPVIWDTHFGYLLVQGYTVALGEFGGKYGHGGSAQDVVWQKAFIDYCISRGIKCFFYWCWNPNSGDTGGILKDDWTTVWSDKYDNLKRLI